MRSTTAGSSETPTSSSRLGRLSDRLPRPVARFIDLVRSTAREGSENELPLFAPALAYALVVSLGPLTFVLNLVSARFVEDARILPGSPLGNTELTAESLVGNRYAWAGPLGIAIVFALVVLGASSLFTQLVRAIRRIWGDESDGLRDFVKSRGLAMLLLAVMGIALFTSAVFGSAVKGVADFIQQSRSVVGEGVGWIVTLAATKVVLDFVFASVLFAVAFTAVPEGDQHLRDVMPGVLMTAAAYALGQQVLGRFLTSSPKLDALGSFGVFVAFLLWAYYTALIVLWGAELTYQLATRRVARRPLEPHRR